MAKTGEVFDLMKCDQIFVRLNLNRMGCKGRVSNISTGNELNGAEISDRNSSQFTLENFSISQNANQTLFAD